MKNKVYALGLAALLALTGCASSLAGSSSLEPSLSSEDPSSSLPTSVAPTDEELVIAAKAALDVPAEASSDFTLPTSDGSVAISYEVDHDAIALGEVAGGLQSFDVTKDYQDVSGSIEATFSKGDASQSESYTVVVPSLALPTIDITTDPSSLWIDETLTLEVSFSDSIVHPVSFASSDVSIATVSTEGLVTAISAGSATITASFTGHSSVSDTVEMTILQKFMEDAPDTVKYPATDKFDFSKMKSDGYIRTNEEYHLYAEAQFKGIKSQKWYAEAHIQIMQGYWVWDTVSIGSRVEEPVNGINFRGYCVSTHEGKKSIVVNNPNTWGETTDRGQVWNQNGMSDLDPADIKLGTLRDGGAHYYFVNDQLRWVEKNFRDFDGIDTIPTVMTDQNDLKVWDFYATADSTLIDAKLAEANAENALFGSFVDNTVVSADSKTVEFIGNTDTGNWTNVKDRRASSKGDAFTMPALADSTVSFDWKITAYGGDSDAFRFGFTMRRYAGAVKESRSVVFKPYEVGMAAWGWDGGSSFNFNGAPDFSLGENLAVNEVLKVSVTRVLSEEGANADGLYNTYHVVIKDASDALVAEYDAGWHDCYSGALLVEFNCIYGNALVENITLS
ncbi:MAG: Ig-like domain-containing protein [Bacilli bacterium]|jgi:hypothetical protein